MEILSNANYGHVIFYSLIGGLLSLAGGALMLSSKKVAKKLTVYAMPFAAGALLAAAFFELLPEAVEQLASGSAFTWALVGLLAFFFLEHAIHWFHHSHHHEDEHKSSAAPLIIIGDSVHNFIDGIAIGAAFLISVPAGIVVAIAVASHEIPQEIGDFGLLLKHGYKRKKVLIINAASALMSTIGAVITFWVGSRASLPIGELLAITAGLFIYIAASDLIPEIHHGSFKKGPNYIAIALLLAGVLVVGGVTELAHNQLAANGIQTHQHNDHSNEQHKEGIVILCNDQEVAIDPYGAGLPSNLVIAPNCDALPVCDYSQVTIEGAPLNTPCVIDERQKHEKDDHEDDHSEYENDNAHGHSH